jgi:hypothetical protein
VPARDAAELFHGDGGLEPIVPARAAIGALRHRAAACRIRRLARFSPSDQLHKLANSAQPGEWLAARRHVAKSYRGSRAPIVDLLPPCVLTPRGE